MAISKVFVIGAGQMGNGIAQVTAQAGYSVIMSDIKEEFVKKGMETISKSLDRGVKKGTMTGKRIKPLSWPASRPRPIIKTPKTLIWSSKQRRKSWNSRKAFSNNSMKSASRMQSWLPIPHLSPSAKSQPLQSIPPDSSAFTL